MLRAKPCSHSGSDSITGPEPSGWAASDHGHVWLFQFKFNKMKQNHRFGGALATFQELQEPQCPVATGDAGLERSPLWQEVDRAVQFHPRHPPRWPFSHPRCTSG